MKIVINLAPSDLQKKGSHFDLAMAIGLLIESNQIRPKNVQKYGFIGELSLNARIRSCAGVLPMIMAAKESGIKDIIVPKDNIKEASLVQGMNIFGFNTLEEVADFLEEKNGYQIPLDESPQTEEHIYPIDFSEVQGQDIMLEYIVIAAAGGQTIRKVAEIAVPEFKHMIKSQQDKFIFDLQYMTRKTACVLAYIVFGVLNMTALLQHLLKMKMRFITVLVICTSYAASDELHQLFVNGRGANQRCLH